MASNDDFRRLIESQNQLRLQNIGCDVIFEIGTKSFPAHRVVLMARLEYFRNMFTADMREKKELTVQFDPLIIDPDFFGDVLNYVYISKIDFTKENLRSIFKAADYFCFDELTTKVKEFMLETMGVENAILYRSIVVEFNLESFRDECEEFIIDNVTFEIIKSQLISTLSLEELERFVAKMKEKRKFEDVFHYCIEWILHDESNRTETLLELLKNIPLESLSYKFLKQTVSKNDLVLKDIDCLTLLLNAVFNNSQPLHSLDISEEPENEPRNEFLYAIGGRDGKPLSSVSKYNSITREWIATTPMPSSRSMFGCAVFGQKIYVCGGSNGQGAMNSMTVFDTHTQTWTELTPMKHARYHCAAAVLNGQIYVAGGFYGAVRLAVVERYCVQTGRWEDVASRSTIRSALELIELNGFLYAIGAYGGDDYLNSVERYDPQTDQWTRMSNMNYKYSYFGSAVLNGNIYIAGGDTCEVYSPADDKWTRIAAPTRCDYGRRLAVYDEKLYAIGGSKVSKTVEVYDFQARVWRTEPDMDVARTNHQLAVVKK